jgi:hypothetical protein
VLVSDAPVQPATAAAIANANKMRGLPWVKAGKFVAPQHWQTRGPGLIPLLAPRGLLDYGGLAEVAPFDNGVAH